MVYGNGMISPSKRIAPRREAEDADAGSRHVEDQTDDATPETKIPAPAWRAAVSER